MKIINNLFEDESCEHEWVMFFQNNVDSIMCKCDVCSLECEFFRGY